jgi:hypothetical protein
MNYEITGKDFRPYYIIIILIYFVILNIYINKLYQQGPEN